MPHPLTDVTPETYPLSSSPSEQDLHNHPLIEVLHGVYTQRYGTTKNSFAHYLYDFFKWLRADPPGTVMRLGFGVDRETLACAKLYKNKYLAPHPFFYTPEFVEMRKALLRDRDELAKRTAEALRGHVPADQPTDFWANLFAELTLTHHVWMSFEKRFNTEGRELSEHIFRQVYEGLGYSTPVDLYLLLHAK